jgi:uncharacterized protein YegL
MLCSLPVSTRAQEFHDNVVILLDASGSMKQTLAGTRQSKMVAAKSALKAVLQTVPQSTRIGLLVFGASNLRDDWAYPLGPRDDGVLLQAIDRIQPSSGTPLGAYMKKAADRLLEERARQFGYGSYRLLVVTDGEAQDQNLVNRYTPDIMARGIALDVIGVAMHKDHTLATKVHSYRRANDPAALSRALAEVFAEVGGANNDAVAGEAFALLAPIPDQVAAAIIQALANTGNQPIGERPKVAVPVPKPEAAAPPAKPRPPPAAGAPAPTTPVASSPAPAPVHSRGKRIPTWVLIVGAIILVSLFSKRARRRTGR